MATLVIVLVLIVDELPIVGHKINHNCNTEHANNRYIKGPYIHNLFREWRQTYARTRTHAPTHMYIYIYRELFRAEL